VVFLHATASYNVRDVNQPDIVIAGAGIIGLSLALDLARQGLAVTVLERGLAMTESSWAAAGMLAAIDPENHPALTELALHSLNLYPDYLAHIEKLSGKKVPIRTTQALQATEPSRLQPKLSPAELRTLVPHLQTSNREFLLLDEPSLDPRDLSIALPMAARAAGVDLSEHSPVIAIEHAPTCILIHTPEATFRATHFVNAAGAWAESPALTPMHGSDHQPRITPRKGQMAAVRLTGRETLNHVLRTSDIYLVPRGNGLVIIGATVEDAGFDKTVEPHAIAALLRTGAELWPPIGDGEIIETWAGLRPGSADELPFIGAIDGPNPGDSPNRPRHYLASGHFRNGILLAPGTARALSRLLHDLNPEIDLDPFDPDRKTTAGEGAQLQPLR
jgi:glycine oxidase